MNILNVVGEHVLGAELHPALCTPVWLHLQMNTLVMVGHAALTAKPLPTLRALVGHTFME